MSLPPLRKSICLSALIAVASPCLRAADSFTSNLGTWDTTTAGWSTVTTGPYTGLWTNGDRAVFEGTASSITIGGAGVTSAGLLFNVGGYTIGGGGLTLSANGVSIGSGLSGTISSVIGGTVGLDKQGTGTLLLTGANGYTGNTSISAGTLSIGNGGSVGTIPGGSAVSISSGATARWDNNNDTTNYVIANNFSGAGTLRLQGYNDVGGGLQNAVYELSGNSSGFTGTLELNRAIAWNTTSPNNVGSAAIVVGDRATMTFNGNTFANNVTVNQDAGWHHNVGSDAVIGAIRLEGNNTLSGNIVINNTASVINGDNTGKNSTIGGWAAGNHSLNGVISGAGDLAMSRYTSWNGGSVQAVNITLGGSASNTYTGKTVVDGQGAVASLILAKTGGAVAIAPNTVVQLGTVTGGQANLRMGGNNQFGSGVLMNFVNNSGQWMRFDLLDTNQTLAGINTGNLTTQGSGVVQNGGINATSSGTSTLTLDGSGSYVFNGHVRNRDNVGTGVLALSKTGTGTQTLIGSVVSYTGATSITGGTLALQDTTAFASAITVGASGTLNVNRTALGLANRSTIMGNGVNVSGVLNINNAGSGEAGGWTTVNGGTGSLVGSGTININSGVLSRDNTNANTINSSATVNVAAGAVFGAGRGGNSTIGALNGAGTVSTLWAGGNAGSITIGNGNNSGTFSGVIRGNGSNATDGTLEGGVLSVIKVGTGTQTLSGSNTYGGSTTVNGGVLDIPAGGVITGNGALLAGGASGGTLSVSGGSVSTGIANVFALSAGRFASQPGTVNLSAGTLSVTGSGGGLVLGTGAPAVFNQTGGTYNHTANGSIYLANGVGGVSTMNLSGGNFTANSAAVFVGERDNSTLTVSGSAVVSLPNAEMWIGRAVDNQNLTGTFNMQGGSVTQGGQYFVVGQTGATGAGIYNQTGGSYTFTGVNGSYIGNNQGAGVMNISGGTFTQTQNLMRLGQNNSSTGTVNLGGGAGTATLSVPTITFGANNALAKGTLNLEPNGILRANNINKGAGSGTFNFNGGTYQPSASGSFTGLTAANVRNPGALFAIGAGVVTTVGQALQHSVIGGDNATDGGLTATITGGGVMYLDGANSYNGPTVVTGGNGYLVPRNNTALGTSAGGVTVATGNTLQLENNITISGESATITGTGVGGTRGALASWTGNNTWTGPVTMAGDSSIHVNANRLTLTGGIGESGGARTLTKTGGGELELAGTAAQTYTGTTFLTNGKLLLNRTGGPAIPGNITMSSPSRLQMLQANQFPVGSVLTITSGNYAEFTLGGYNQTLGGLVSNASGVIQNGHSSDSPAPTSSSILTIDNAAPSSHSGYFRDRAGIVDAFTLGLTKLGSSSLTLSGGQITYTGPTTISAGTFVLSDTTAFGSAIQNNALVQLSGTGGWTLSPAISGSGEVQKVNTGSVTLGGSAANTYTGLTTVNTGNLYLGKTGGAVAIPGDIQLGAGNTSQPNLRMQQNNQFGPTTMLTFGNTAGNWGRFDLAATTQTLRGLNAGTAAFQGGAVIQNVGLDGVGSGAGTLVLDGSGTYVYNGYLRDQDNGGTTNKLNLNKTGSGTQTLAGNVITHTGTTTIGAGTLSLYRAGQYRSPTTNNATLNYHSDIAFGSRQNGLDNYAQAQVVDGSGTITKTGTGWVGFYNTVNFGPNQLLDIQAGRLGNDNTTANWSSSLADINIASGAVLDLRANDIYGDALTGAGEVWQSHSANGNYHTLFLGRNNGSGTFNGIIRGNDTGADDNQDAAFLGLTKQGTGTQTLTGVNTFAGDTRVEGGTLAITQSLTLGNSNYVHDNLGGTLDYGTLTALTFGGLKGAQNLNLVNPNNSQPLALSLGNNSQANTYTGALSGAGSLTKVGVGTQTLGGASANTYTGGTVVNNAGSNAFGPLILAKPDGVNAIPGSIQIGNSGTGYATLQLGANQQIPDASVLNFVGTVNNWSYFKLMGFNETVAGLNSAANGVIENMEGETVNVNSVLTVNNPVDQSYTGYMRNRAGGSGTGTLGLTKLGAGIQTFNGANITYSGPTTISAGGIVLNNTTGFNSDVSIAPTTSLVMNNSTGNWPFGKSITGTGSLTLNGSNTSGQGHFDFTNATLSGFTGAFALANGARLMVNGESDLPGIASMTVTAGNQIMVNGGTITKPMTIAGNGWIEPSYTTGLGALRILGGATLSGPITLAGNARVGEHTSETGIISGVISDGGAGYTLEKFGPGNLYLSGTSANTYTGVTVVNNGSLYLDKIGAVAVNNSVQVGAGNTSQPNLRMNRSNQFGPGVVVSFPNASGNWARFDLLDTDQTIAGLSGGTLATQGSGVVQNGGNGQNWTTQTSILTLNGSGNYLLNGHVRDIDTGGSGKLAITKSGSGTQTLVGGVVSYTGNTTITGGTLELVNATAFNSAVNIGSGAFFNQTRTTTGDSTYSKNVTGSGTWLVAGNGGASIGGHNMTGNNSGFTGTLNIDDARFVVTSNNNLPSGVINATSGGQVFFAAAGAYTRALNIGGNGWIEGAYPTGLGAIRLSNGADQAGQVNLVANARVGAHTGDTGTISGVIAGNGFGIEKFGPGTVNFTNPANTFNGPTTLNQGTLVVSTGSEQTLGANPGAYNAAQLLLNGGTLHVQGASLTLNDSNRGVAVGTSGGTFRVDPGLNLSLDNALTGIDGSLNKAGAGNLNLTANNDVGSMVVAEGSVVQSGGITRVRSPATGLKVENTASYSLSAGTLRTDVLDLTAGGTFTWGAGALTHSQTSSQDGTQDFSSSGYTAVKTGTTLDIKGSLTTGGGSNLALHNSPTLYLSGDVRFNNVFITGDLMLTAPNDSLTVEINPLLLRPFSPSLGTAATESGSLPLVVVDGNLTGTFDTFGQVFMDSQGFAQYAGVFTSAAALPLNTWFLEYAQDVVDTTGALTGQGPGTYDLIFFHYRVAGYVPEPDTFLMLGFSVVGLRTVRLLRERRRQVLSAAG